MTKERRVWSSEEEKKKKKHCEKSILYTVDPRYNEDLQTGNWLLYKRYFFKSGDNFFSVHCSGNHETLRIKRDFALSDFITRVCCIIFI